METTIKTISTSSIIRPSFVTRDMNLKSISLDMGRSSTYLLTMCLNNPLTFSLMLQLGKGDILAGYYEFNTKISSMNFKLTALYFYLKETKGRKISELFDDKYDNVGYKNQQSFRASITKMMFCSGIRYRPYHKYYYLVAILEDFKSDFKTIQEEELYYVNG